MIIYTFRMTSSAHFQANISTLNERNLQKIQNKQIREL